MRLHVLVNGEAGSVDDEDEQGEAARIRRALDAAGADAVVEVLPARDFPGAVSRVWDGPERPDAVLVAGGDGTVNCAASVAVGTDVVIGVLPLGTFNHFAKDLGVPTDLDEAAVALVAGEVRSVDVAEVNGRVFVNNSVLGLYPEMVAVRDRIRDERGWGKVRAVPVALLRVLRSFPVHRLDLAGSDGYARPRVRTPFVFVGNGVYDNPRGGAATRDDLTDGRLGVAVARVVSRWGLVRTAVRSLVSGGEQARDLDTAEVAELTVTVRAPRIRVAVDGEIDWFTSPLRYRIRPAALHVLAPTPPEIEVPEPDERATVEGAPREVESES